MRVLKVWGLAQILNLVPYLYFLKVSIGWEVMGYVGIFSFIGGLPVLLAFAINESFMVINNRTGKQTFITILVLWPIFAACGAYTLAVAFHVEWSDSWPFVLIPTIATVIAIVRYRKLFLVDSVDEASY
jgi:hypothetical protein